MGSHVRLNRPRKDKTTLKDHYEQVLRTTGRRPKDYEEYAVPPALQYLWDMFWELDRSRDRSMGCAPISEQELYYWQKNKKYELLPWERSAILKMDIAYCEEMGKSERD